MKKLQRSIILTFIMFSIVFTFCVSHSHAFELTIDVAPNILNIQSNSNVVTIHTNIAYVDVLESTLSINEVEIETTYSKADDQGNFVAKFVSDEVKDLAKLSDGSIAEVLKLVLIVVTGTDSFEGWQEIMVVDNISQGNK